MTQSAAVPPSYFTNAEKVYYEENQKKVLKSITRDMQTPDQITTAKARIIVAIDEIIAVNEVGVPKSVLKRAEQTTNRGYVPDMTLRCSERIETVIEKVSENAYIAQDILKGVNIVELARSPKAYARRKDDNCQTNAARSKDLNYVKKLRNGEQVVQQIAKEGRRKRGPKPKAKVEQKQTMLMTPAATRIGSPLAPLQDSKPVPNPNPVSSAIYQTPTNPYGGTSMSGQLYTTPASTGKRTFDKTELDSNGRSKTSKRTKPDRYQYVQVEGEEADAEFELDGEEQAEAGSDDSEDIVAEDEHRAQNSLVPDD